MSTTATEHTDPKAIIYALNQCIETCTDGEKAGSPAGLMEAPVRTWIAAAA